MKEVWLPVRGYEGLYEVSDLGRVRSLDRSSVCIRHGKPVTQRWKGRILKPAPSGNTGYLTICLQNNGDCVTAAIHRLVAEAFVPNTKKEKTVDHINDVKTDNRAANLRWLSLGDNRWKHARGIDLQQPA